MTAAKRYTRLLADVLDRREREAPGRVRRARVDGREEDGRLRLLHLDGTCVLSSEIGAEGTGDEITLPTGPLYHRGTTGVATNSLYRETATLYLERLDPDLYLPGESYTVQVHGRGFTEATEMDFLLEDSNQIHPDITVTEQRFVSSSLLEFDIDIDPDAGVLAALPVAFDDFSEVN